MYENLEGSIIEGAARFKRGDTGGVDVLVQALKQIKPNQIKLIPLIGTLLKLDNSDIQVFASCALARFGEKATDHVESLIEVMNSHKFPGSDAAACALGEIKSPKAIDALVAALKTYPLDRMSYLATGLKSSGIAGIPAIRGLQRLSRNPAISNFSKACVDEALASINSAARAQHETNIQNTDLFEYPTLYSEQNKNITAYEHYAPFSVPANTAELCELHNGRFRFLYNSTKSEMGLRVYRTESGSYFVVMSWDGQAYGVTPTNASEIVATAVMHMFNLDPNKTTWFERYTQSSGRMEEECTFVHYQFEEERGVLFNPNWRPCRNFVDLFRENGIEW